MINTWPKAQAGESVALCTTLAERMKGLMGEKHADSGRHVALVPCRAVHTYGMDAPIDVAFVGKDGKVVASYERVPPGSRLSCRNACMALERRAQGGAPWFRCGDQVFALPEPLALLEAADETEVEA